MIKSVFEYENYKKYLNDYIESQPKGGRGLKKKWAEIAGCQVAYISHVLAGSYDFSCEQVEAISKALGHSRDEIELLILLVQLERAGTHSLKSFFQKSIEEKKEKYALLRNRMKIKETLDREDQMIYYSKWYYSAVHMILTIPEFRTPEKIAAYLSLPLNLTREALSFLQSRDLAQLEKGQYTIKGPFLHLENDSPFISQHHTNWRMKSLQSLELAHENDLHFSSCFSISKDDMVKIKTMVSRHIQESAELIKPSKEERLMALCIDLFEV